MHAWLALYLTRNLSFSLPGMLSFDQENLNYIGQNKVDVFNGGTLHVGVRRAR
jgi:hypothetical protein